MFRSMTAYGRATIQTALGRFTAEIRSLNRKFLEISTLLPNEFSRFEPEIKTKIASCISRGQVSLSISVNYETVVPIKISPNLPLARQLKHAWDEIAEALKVKEEAGFHLGLLKEQPDLFYCDTVWEKEESYKETLFQVIDQAVEQMMEMKNSEGRHLAEDIDKRIKFLQKNLDDIALFSQDAPQKYRQKLLERFEDLLPGRVENEERILREIVLYADKVDISEEITRFRSHLDRFQAILASNETSVGKKIEFMIQELGREINTMGSKAADLRISYLVVDCKTELEKIREQIQNVE